MVTHPLQVLIATLVLAGCAVLSSFFVNVNYFALNAVYRHRLVRAFLGASNIKAVTGKEPARNSFDDWAEKSPDNPPMAQVWKKGREQPFPVVNIALNLTATEDNAWQERKAAGFTVTPLHAGGPLVGYRPANEYAGGLTLGTAMAISGAAVSPNWGYHSSTLTSFVLTLFNVRLGQWLGNPGQDRWKSDGPRFGGLTLFRQEALGQTSERHRYVYLSDGGHFDNLGLYEMVRRRCGTIVVIDAGADPGADLADLGNALRKIAIDFDVQIEFGQIDMGRRGSDPANPGVYCAVGKIKYPETERKGDIVYIKAGLYGVLPADVRAHAAANAKFPHDTTLNQWFTESQFESYRALGRHAINKITERGIGPARTPTSRPENLAQFVLAAEEYVARYALTPAAMPPTRVRLIS